MKGRIGSLDPRKQAHLVVFDCDILAYPEDEIRQARAQATHFDGNRVFERRE